MRACARMSFVWNGAHFEREGGSDTEESDSEQPLAESEQIVAILNTRRPHPPPLPVDAKHALMTAMAVQNHIHAIPHERLTISQDYALKAPVVAQKIENWIEQQLGDRRTERTIRHAFCFALNPNRSNVWVAKKVQGSGQTTGVAKGMALHLRCHPFTRSDVQRGCGLLRLRLLPAAGCGAGAGAGAGAAAAQHPLLGLACSANKRQKAEQQADRGLVSI